MNQTITPYKPLKSVVLTGLLIGIVGAILGNVTAVLLETIYNIHVQQLSIVSISLASIVTNLVGSFIFYFLTRKTRRPVQIFAVLALVVATLDTIQVSVNPPESGFGTIADPLHYIVAITTIILLPLLTKDRQNV